MAENQSLCLMCNEPHTQICTSCRSSRYCSRECQQADWPTHKLLCNSFTAFQSTNRPDQDDVRAILFPGKRLKPEFIWLRCPWYYGGATDYQSPKRDRLNSLLDESSGEMVSFQVNAVLRRNLSNTLRIVVRESGGVDGSELNESILNVTACKPGYLWPGPIVAYGMSGLGRDQAACRDVDMADYRHFIDYFLAYRAEDMNEGRLSNLKAKGIKINCAGDMKVYNVPMFEAVDVPYRHPIFNKRGESDIARLIRLPLLAHKYPVDPAWSHPDSVAKLGDDPAWLNTAASILHRTFGMNAPDNDSPGGWGFPTERWFRDVRSVLIVREDKKALQLMHMGALERFSRVEVAQLLQTSSSGDVPPESRVTKEFVLSMLCKSTFSIFWEKFAKEQQDQGATDIPPSPYSI